MSTIHPSESPVFHRELDRRYPLIVRAEGYRVHDDEGREYLDAIGGGAGVTNIGYGVPEVLEAARNQVGELPFIHNQKFTNPLQEELAAELVSRAPGFSRVVFCQGGAEANETALRLARSYHVERGETDRWRIVSVAQAYHGSTMATLALTGRPALQYPYVPYLPEFLHIPPADPDGDPDGRLALEGLERAILDAGPETIAAFWAEPVHAASAPGLRFPDGFFEGLADLAEQHGFLVAFDEVVTGIGRTGTFLAVDRLPIRPDVVTVAKGLGGGYVPMGAVLCTERVYRAVEEGSRDFSHGHTFNGYPLGCAVSLAVLRYLDAHELLDRVASLGPAFLETLRASLADAALVHEVRGEGFMFGITFRDEHGGFLDPALKLARRIDVAALDEGLFTYSTQPTSDGYAGDQTWLAPAFTTTEADWTEIVARLRRAIDRVERDVASGAPLATAIG